MSASASGRNPGFEMRRVIAGPSYTGASFSAPREFDWHHPGERSANSRRTHVGRDWAGGRPPAPSTLAPTLTPALPRGSQDSSGAADWRSRGFQGRELLLRRIGRKDANKPVVGPSFLGLFFTVASHWDAWQTTAAGLPCSDPRPWRLGSRWSSDIPDGVEESATP